MTRMPPTVRWPWRRPLFARLLTQTFRVWSTIALPAQRQPSAVPPRWIGSSATPAGRPADSDRRRVKEFSHSLIWTPPGLPSWFWC